MDAVCIVRFFGQPGPGKIPELTRLGFRELLTDPRNLIALEWAEKVENLLPSDTVRIRFRFVDEATREIEMLE